MREAIEVTLSIILGLVFLASAIPKLRHPKGFILTVLVYGILPPSLGDLYARVLPPLELLVALLLLTGTAVRPAAVITSILLASFVVAVSVNLIRGRDLGCGCFGAGGGRRIGPELVLQDIGLLVASIISAVLGNGWLMLASWSLFRLGGFSGAAAPAALVACAALTVACAVGLPMSRRQTRRWTAALRRWGRRWDAKTAAD